MLAPLHAYVACAYHKESGKEMADAQKALGWNPAVGHHAKQTRHEERNNTLNGVKRTDVFSQTYFGQIVAHGGQISAPHGKL